MKRFRVWSLILLALWPALAARGADNGALKQQLNDLEVQGAWIYNDLNAGFAEAKRTGKPLLVVFRCVP